MGWIGSLTSDSAVGSSITWTPNSPESTNPKTEFISVASYAGNYSVDSFTAPKRGIYEFTLKGSGGARLSVTNGDSHGDGNLYGAKGGKGGSTTGYLLLEKDETVYVGAGGVCRAAFVSSVNGSSLSAIDKTKLYFVAGAGGSGASWYDSNNWSGYNCKISAGGNGGGSSGAAGSKDGATNQGAPVDADPGGGGTQSAGGAAGTSDSHYDKANGSAGTQGKGGSGGSCSNSNNGKYKARGGRGGDGYYGGGGGACSAADNGLSASGGGGGSGYVKTASFTHMGTTYKSTTSQGGGASSNNAGSVVVKYYAMGELPIVYNGNKITELVFNGTKVTSVIYNETKLF